MTTLPPEPTDSAAARDLQDFLEEGAEVSVETLDTSRAARGRLPIEEPLDLVLPDAGDVLSGNSDGGLVTLVIAFSDVQDPPSHPIAVLVNTPDPPGRAEMASAPGFVGTLSFFGADHHSDGPTVYRLEASRPVTNMDVAGELTVTLLPMPEPDRKPDGQALDVEVSLEIATSRVER